MTPIKTSMRSDVTTVVRQPEAANGLAMVRLTIGAMFVSVFFENLGKGLYTPAGYAGLIRHYIKASHSPAAWKTVMGLVVNHAAMAAPLQAMTRSVSASCSSSVSLPDPPQLWPFCISAAFGSRSGAPRGSGNYWFRCSHPSVSLSDAPAADGAWTHGCRNVGHLLCGGDWAKCTCECPSSFLPITKRKRLSAF